jgi:hypothetical protein
MKTFEIHPCLPKSENLHLQFYIEDLTAGQAEGELYIFPDIDIFTLFTLKWWWITRGKSAIYSQAFLGIKMMHNILD